MTAAELRALPPDACAALYALLGADRLPIGTFDGVAWPATTLLGLVWRGKVFDHGGTRVRNRIGGHLLVTGTAALVEQTIVITYPRLGLTDTLRLVTPGLYLGRMALGAHVVSFTLSRPEAARHA